MSKKVAPACQCSKLSPIGCDTPMTQEDLLCDACRAGCNCVFSKIQAGPLTGPHFYAEIVMRTAPEGKINA